MLKEEGAVVETLVETHDKVLNILLGEEIFNVRTNSLIFRLRPE